jgi:lactate permease
VRGGLPPVTLWRWLLAVLPVIVLAGLVLWGRFRTSTNALITVAAAVVVGAVAFGAGPAVLGVGLGKGVWTGVWILYVVWTALLLYQLARRAGLPELGGAFSSILRRPVENVLVVAWVFPAFVQGVAGFGTPIAVSAPLLAAMGYGPVQAVAFPLIGYHWSVTFGSMGSSFYMAAFTAGLSNGELHHYAVAAALLLGANAIVSGALVCLMHGGLASLRQGARMVAVVGPMMAAAMLLSVQVEPSIGGLAAGAAGFLGVGLLRALTGRGNATAPAEGPGEGSAGPAAAAPARPGGSRSTAPTAPAATAATAATAEGRAQGRRAVVVLLPYVYLLVVVLAVLVPATSRAWVKAHLLIGPSFGPTRTGYGLTNPAAEHYTVIALLSHPGTYILLAALLGLATYRLAGLWPRGQLGETLRDWREQVWAASPPIVALAAVATVMVDSGMVRMIAVGAADAAGGAFPAISGLIGALGSFTTGSTTSSNALFSALQRDVALLIGVRPADLLAAQTSGGNIGNSLAPVVILIGLTAVGARDRVGEVLRSTLLPAAVLAMVVAGGTLLLVARS